MWEDDQTAGYNSRQKLKDSHIERLQVINMKLRNRIKDLNQVVEKALEKQQNKIAIGGARGSQDAYDTDHVLRIREKEIQNSKKQMEHNKVVIDRLKKKLKALGQGEGGDGDTRGDVVSWEEKYAKEVSNKKELERQIKELEKTNQKQGN